MSATLIDGKGIAQQIIRELRQEMVELKSQRGITPSLALVLVGEHPPNEVFARNKIRACEQVGIRAELVRLGGEATLHEVWAALEKLNSRADLAGVLVQFPLPRHLPEERVLHMLDPRKDVEGLHPSNLGSLCLGQPKLVPCGAAAILELLHRLRIEVAGRQAVVVGTSHTVGKPAALLLLDQGAAVTLCDPRTPNLDRVTSNADILIVASGDPGMLRARHIKPGAVVVDAAVSRLTGELDVRRTFPADSEALALYQKQRYLLAGAVARREVEQVAGYLTPVPGGVGPVVLAMLLKNIVQAAGI